MRVIDCAHRLATDINPSGSQDAQKLDGFVRSIVAAITDTLGLPATGYGDFERKHLTEIFRSMQATHFSIRRLLKGGADNPGSIDALALARVQLEALYSVCLMVEDPAAISLYVKNRWKKTYIKFLLRRQELSGLTRFNDYLQNVAPRLLKQLQSVTGVTEDERVTVESEELGTPLPAGVQPTHIDPFPTPGRLIDLIRDAHRKRMLVRFYAEYRVLSDYVHGSPDSAMFRSVFDERSPYRDVFSSGQREELFQREIGEVAILISVLSVAQSACRAGWFGKYARGHFSGPFPD